MLKQGPSGRRTKHISQELSDAQIRELDKSTDKILSNIEDPERIGSWQSRGLVIGDVQSGKTGNFIGVIAKALDTKYDLVIILSGVHNSLRVQTQKRFEEAITGFNTEKKYFGQSCGIASQLTTEEREKHNLAYWTSRDNSGDLKSTKNPGTFPKFSINKKNASTLRNVIHHLKGYLNEGSIQHNKSIPLIDDEADNASVNTKKPDLNPSTINALIRELLQLFTKNAYIGYTATPFANALIDQLRMTSFQGTLWPFLVVLVIT